MLKHGGQGNAGGHHAGGRGEGGDHCEEVVQGYDGQVEGCLKLGLTYNLSDEVLVLFLISGLGRWWRTAATSGRSPWVWSPPTWTRMTCRTSTGSSTSI